MEEKARADALLLLGSVVETALIELDPRDAEDVPLYALLDEVRRVLEDMLGRQSQANP